jgi:hypothetical protein
MLHRNTLYLRLTLLTALLPLIGCGGSSSPASPSGVGVVLNGVVIGPDAASSSADVSAQSTSGGRITVTVEGNPSLSTTVSANGTFVLEGLPAGSFTLVFSKNGVVIGTITITGVGEQVEIHIVVQVTSTTVTLINLDMGEDKADGGSSDSSKTCLISGGRGGEKIELEGNVASGSPTAFKMDVNGNRASRLVDVSASGAQFVCNGDKKGSSSTCQASVKAGAKIHVRGTLTSCTLDVAQVVATEVKVQKD